jgi:outer membrane protein assembly factor BamB
MRSWFQRARIRALATLPALVTLITLAPAAPTGAAPLWTLTTEREIVFQRLTPLGSLLVSTEGGLMAVDPATGKALWTRADVQKLKECNYDEIANTSYGLLELGEGVGGTQRRIEVIDLATGAKKWDSGDLPMNSSQGQLQVAHQGMLVMCGLPKQGKKPVLVAVGADDGAMKWQQDEAFTKPLNLIEVRGSGKLFKRFSIDGNQGPVFDTEHTMIAYLTAEGPVKLDLATGNRLWTAPIKARVLPALKDGYAPMLFADGRLFVPYDKSLQAVDPATGALLWARDRDFKSKVTQMEMTPGGLVVRGAPGFDDKGKADGKPFLDLLDPKTGLSLWKKPFKDLEDATTFDRREDRLFIAADGELFAVNLADGVASSVTKFKFKGGEAPGRLEVVDGDYVLSSSQNVMRIDAAGTVKFHTFHSAPGQSGFIKIISTAAVMTVNAASAAQAHSMAWNNPGTTYKYTLYGNPELSRRFKASQHADAYLVMLTGGVEADGRKGVGLVKVEKATGADAAKVVLGDKTPEYELDPIDGRVFFKKSDTEIICYGF